MSCLFVYNPISGKGKIAKKIKYIQRVLTNKFGKVEIIATQRAGELSELAEKACGKYDYFIFAGGDGSFNEVVNGLKEHENKPILGYIPTGTVNDIARSMGIKRTVKGSLKNIVNGKVEQFDVMKINDRYAMYVCVCGGITACSYQAKQSDKQKMGKLAYALEIIKHNLVFEDFEMKFETEDLTFNTNVVLVMIMNSRSVSSFWLNPDAVMNDGLFEVLIVKQHKKPKEAGFFRHIRYFLKSIKVFLFGYRNMRFDKNMFTYQGNKAKIKVSDDIVWNFDGDQGVKGDIDVSIVRNNVKVIIPKNKKP